MTELEKRVNELTTRVELLELENSKLREHIGLIWNAVNMHRLDHIERQQKEYNNETK